jgi:hypothetical protein
MMICGDYRVGDGLHLVLQCRERGLKLIRITVGHVVQRDAIFGRIKFAREGGIVSAISMRSPCFPWWCD